MRYVTILDKNKREYLLFVLFFVVIGFSIAPLPILVTHRFIALTVLLITWFVNIFLNSKENLIKIIFSDIGWLALLVLSFFSYIWAIDCALIWYSSFSYLVVVLFMLLLRTAPKKNVLPFSISTVFFSLFFLYLLYVAVILLSGQVRLPVDWNRKFGYNYNYVSALFLILYPFVFFYPNKKNAFILLKVVGLIFTFFISFKVGARGTILALSFFILYGLWIKIPKKYFYGLLSGSLLLSAIAFYFSLNDLWMIQRPGDSARAGMLYNSLLLFFENPLVGVGAGNWQLEAYKYGVHNVSVFNNPNTFFRLVNHDYFSKHLSELGILGFLAFIYPIGVVLQNVFLRKGTMLEIEKAACGSLLIYIILSFFYRDANFYENHFGGIQLVAFGALGILTCNIKFYFFLDKRGEFLTVILAISCLVWFKFYQYTTDRYLKIANSSKSIAIKIKTINSIYNPVFKTTHGFYEGSNGVNRSLALELAELYQKKHNYIKAEEYFRKALVCAPYNEFILLAYARFLFEIKKEFSSAKQYLLRIRSIQDYHFEVNFLLSRIEVEEKRYTIAKSYLDEINSKEFEELMKQNKNYIKIFKQYLIFKTEAQFLRIEILMKEKDYEKIEKCIVHLSDFLKEYKILDNKKYENRIDSLEEQLIHLY